ncbi:uncharacterized protein [Aristolochia californica]|uniref:uncharacterized protein n=1 Tax=Aristolochia californica TaxID=171875 RepID=UPI0035DC2A7B
MAAKSLISVLPLLCLVFVSVQIPRVANAHGISYINKISCEDLTKDQLNTCLNAYTSAVSSLQEVDQAFAAKKYDVAKLGTVLDGAAQCGKAFEKGNGFLLADENSNLRQLVTIAQALHRFATKHTKH